MKGITSWDSENIFACILVALFVSSLPDPTSSIKEQQKTVGVRYCVGMFSERKRNENVRGFNRLELLDSF